MILLRAREGKHPLPPSDATDVPAASASGAHPSDGEMTVVGDGVRRGRAGCGCPEPPSLLLHVNSFGNPRGAFP
jgi:hypothetical protein